MKYKKAFVCLIVSLLVINILIISVNAQEQINKNIFDKIGDFFKNVVYKITGKTITGYAIHCWSNSDCLEGQFCYIWLPGCVANPARDCPTSSFYCTDSAYCGDGTCNGAETCSTCGNDCGSCATKSNGQSCSSNSECSSGNCGNGICCQYDTTCCTSTSQCENTMICDTSYHFCKLCGPFCFPEVIGNGECDSGCNIAACNYDGGDCPAQQTTKKANGQSCSYSSSVSTECQSGQCYNNICCEYGKTCCSFSSQCTSGYTCGNNYYCIISTTQPATTKYSNGHSCTYNSDCNSENCKNNVCCEYSKTCCAYNSECSSLGSSYTCSASYFYCITPTAITTTKKGFCESCSLDSDCSSGVCKWFADNINRCTTNDADVWCCEDKHYIIGYKQYTDCCSDSACGTGYMCVNYKCQLTASLPSLKAIGQSCSSSSECSEGTCVNNICNCNDCNGDLECDVPNIPCNEEVAPATEQTTSELIPLTGIVVSTSPYGDEEAEEVKKLIEEKILPGIVGIFGDRRELDVNINLVMTDKESVAEWNEKTNTLTVPYKNSYEIFLDYDKEVLQKNGIAHELTHYNLNGLALEKKGNYKKVPLWLREGIAEYGAHAYLVIFEGFQNSISQVRADTFTDYLMNKNYNYKETVEKNAIEKISWEDYDFKDIESKDHVYYGAVFHFLYNYWLKKENRVYYGGAGTSAVELREIFVAISDKDLKTDDIFTKQEKQDWFNSINTQLGIKSKLGNKPCSWWEKIFGCKRE